MIKKRIQKLINRFDKYKIDGYVIPKNDEFFSEYSICFQMLSGAHTHLCHIMHSDASRRLWKRLEVDPNFRILVSFFQDGSGCF